MKFGLILIILLPFLNGFSQEVTSPPQAEIDRLDLDPFYRKYTSADGFPIVSSKKVSDIAHREAAYLVEKMLGNRRDILNALIEGKVRFTIMAVDEFTTDVPEHSHLAPKAYWDKRARGIGSSPDHPAVSCGEENLLRYKGDPYMVESIFVHEFAHSIHQQGLNAIDPAFQKRLETAFNRASLEGLWKGKYAGTNPAEYWAEGVQSWFDTNRENDHDHNHVNTRAELKEHDPLLAELVASVFGDTEWRYTPPAERLEEKHLAGLDALSDKSFAWPKEVVEAFEAHQRGEGMASIRVRPPAQLAAGARSPGSKKSVNIRVKNGTAETIGFTWIDFDGKRKQYDLVDPGREFRQQTFEGHLWLVTGESGKEISWFAAPDADGFVTIK